jgi:hypothetical protein
MFCLSDYFEIVHFTVESEVATEPPRDSRRQFSLSQAATADSSCWR